MVLVCEMKIRSEGWIGVPHLLQKRESSEISAWHLGHFIAIDSSRYLQEAYQLMNKESIGIS
jgi:hypothetical protein